MTNKENKQPYPKPIVGGFIFNSKGELFLMRSPKWSDRFVCPGGGVEIGESREQALEREIKEETGMQVQNIEFLAAMDAVGLGKEYHKNDKHLIFHNYTAQAKKPDKVELNDEGTEYKWLTPEDWLQRDDLEDYTRQAIKYYQESKDDYKDLYHRALADYQNLQKRAADEKNEFAKYANEQLLISLLPVFDNLKISIEHFDNQKDTNAWLEGIKFVVKQFREVLDELGVEEIKTLGEKFDHNTMDAVEGEGDVVTQEVKPGYKLHGKVIIPAKVVVGDGNT